MGLDVYCMKTKMKPADFIGKLFRSECHKAETIWDACGTGRYPIFRWLKLNVPECQQMNYDGEMGSDLDTSAIFVEMTETLANSIILSAKEYSEKLKGGWLSPRDKHKSEFNYLDWNGEGYGTPEDEISWSYDYGDSYDGDICCFVDLAEEFIGKMKEYEENGEHIVLLAYF